MGLENSNIKPIKLIFLTGPTGVGKSSLSLKIAEIIGAEIISMDSMQIYKGMDVGTDKIDKKEMRGIKHHMLDIVEPGERFTVEDYQQMAYKIIDDILERGKFPLFVGGTGLYLDSIIYDYKFANININHDLRKKLISEYDNDNGKTLYEQLKKIDIKSYEKFHISEKKKIVRALEVYYTTGQTISSTKTEDQISPLWEPLIIILDDERDILYDRINKRVDKMIRSGLEEENIKLYNSLKNNNNQAFQAIGYQEYYWYFRGLITKEEMILLIKRFSRNYAKRQQTWFKRYDKALKYSKNEFSEEEILTDIIKNIKSFLKKEM